MADTRWMTKAVDWLGAGRPLDMPSTDYVPIFGLLHHRTSEVEVLEVAGRLAVWSATTRKAITDEQIRLTFARLVHQRPLVSDVATIRAVLERAGYPLAELKTC